MSDTTTIDRPDTAEPAPSGTGPGDEVPYPAAARERSESLAIFAVVFAAIGVLTSLFAVGLSVRAVQQADRIENPPAVATGGGTATTSGPILTLTEFKIIPDTLEVPAGTVLTLVNDGTIAHDVMIDGYRSDTIDAGDTTTFDISMLAPGTYDMICEVTGHKDSGMTGTITVT